MRHYHTLLLLRGGLYKKHAPLPHIGEEMFKKTEKGLRVGELNLIMAKSNCGKSSFIIQELTTQQEKAITSKLLQNHHKKTDQD